MLYWHIGVAIDLIIEYENSVEAVNCKTDLGIGEKNDESKVVHLR